MTHRASPVLVLVLAVLVAASLAALVLMPHDRPHKPDTITEDDPRWDCATMGNHVCGPTHTGWSFSV